MRKVEVTGSLATLDVPGTVCEFGIRCGQLAVGAGGFDRHHMVPKFLGGLESGTLLVLCPTHHRRQHSIIRYMIENETALDLNVLHRFSSKELNAARAGLKGWIALGRPTTTYWEVSAARLLTKKEKAKHGI